MDPASIYNLKLIKGKNHIHLQNTNLSTKILRFKFMVQVQQIKVD
jgi:hypothetical protein